MFNAYAWEPDIPWKYMLTGISNNTIVTLNRSGSVKLLFCGESHCGSPSDPNRLLVYLYHYLCKYWIRVGYLGYFQRTFKGGDLYSCQFISWYVFSPSGFLSTCFHQPPRRMKNVQWQHDLFEDSLRASGISGIEIGTKLYVSNLDYGVTKEDIRVQLKPYIFD